MPCLLVDSMDTLLMVGKNVKKFSLLVGFSFRLIKQTVFADFGFFLLALLNPVQLFSLLFFKKMLSWVLFSVFILHVYKEQSNVHCTLTVCMFTLTYEQSYKMQCPVTLLQPLHFKTISHEKKLHFCYLLFIRQNKIA